MKLGKSILAVCCCAMMAGAVFAKDQVEPTTKPVRKAKPVMLSKPWSLLTDLTAEQKEQISKIHVDANAEVAKIHEKETADIEAVLTDAQKEELQKAEEKEKEDKKAATKKEKGEKSPTTKPSSD